MLNFNGLLGKLLVLVLTASIAVPHQVIAQVAAADAAVANQAQSPDEATESLFGYVKQVFQVSPGDMKRFMSNAGDAIGDTWSDPKAFYPAMIMDLVLTGGAYFWRSQAYKNQTKKYLLNAIKSEGDFKEQLSLITRQQEVAHRQLRKALVGAKETELGAVRHMLPEKYQALLDKDLKAKGINWSYINRRWLVKNATTDIEEIAQALTACHEADKNHYNLVKTLAPKLEAAQKLPMGTITRQLKNPTEMMTAAQGFAKKVPNLGKYADEVRAFEAELIRLGAKNELYGDLALKGKPWFTWSWTFKNSKAGNFSRLVMRKTWPAVLITGVVATGFVTNKYLGKLDKQAHDAEATSEINRQNHTQAILSGIATNNDAHTLMVEILWRDLQDRYQKRFQLACPVSFNESLGNEIVAQALLAAHTDYLKRRQSPFDKDNEYSVEFYRKFWETFFMKAEERSPELKLIPKTANPDKPNIVSLDVLVDQLANQSTSAFDQASQQIHEYRYFLAVLMKMEKGDRADHIKSIPDERMRAILSARVRQLESYEERGLDENGLPKDPDPETTKSELGDAADDLPAAQKPEEAAKPGEATLPPNADETQPGGDLPPPFNPTSPPQPVTEPGADLPPPFNPPPAQGKASPGKAAPAAAKKGK